MFSWQYKWHENQYLMRTSWYSKCSLNIFFCFSQTKEKYIYVCYQVKIYSKFSLNFLMYSKFSLNIFKYFFYFSQTTKNIYAYVLSSKNLRKDANFDFQNWNSSIYEKIMLRRHKHMVALFYFIKIALFHSKVGQYIHIHARYLKTKIHIFSSKNPRYDENEEF